MNKSSTEEESSEKVRRKDGHSSQSRLYRASVQLAQRLDIQIRSATDWQELFQAETIAVRQRLRSQCEQLMLNHAKEYGRKTEELLWRKVFYDVIQMLRQQRKAIGVDEALDSAFRTHLVSASGYYHHLLLQLQLRYKVQLDGIVSWGYAKTSPFGSLKNGADADVQDWAIKACQRCLICLGDLARYQQDVDGEQNAIFAKRLYCEAVLVNPHLGMPHNQLGTLCSNQFYGCEGAYYYMRCLLSKHVFEGAEGNLVRLFERNRSALQRIKELPEDASEEDRVKRFLVYFLHLQDVLYGHESSPKVSSDEVGHLCQSVLQDLTGALIADPVAPSEPNATSTSAGTAQTNGDLADGTSTAEKADGIITSSLMVKLVTMAIMAVTMLKNKGSPQTSVATAFNLELLSQLLKHCISCLEHPERYYINHSAMSAQKSLPVENGLKDYSAGKCNGSLEDHAKLHKVRKVKKALKNRRRRRRQISGDSFGSESESDLEGHSFDNDDSDLSEGCEADELDDDGMTSEEGSDDVYVESESETEGEVHNSAPRTLFFSSHGAKDSLKEAGKLLSQQVAHKQVWDSGLLKQNGFAINRISRMDQSSDLSDADTEASFASSVLTTRSVDLRECPESTLLRGVVRDKLLPSVKVLSDWLRVNPDIITTCVESSSGLLSRIASLLNILPSPVQITSAVAGSKLSLWRNLFEEAVDAEWVQTRVLPEDICVLGFAPLEDLHSKLNLRWNRPPKDSKYLEAAVRIQCLTSFGKQLASMEALETFNWDDNTQKFVGPRQIAPIRDKPNKFKNDAGPKATASQNQDRRARVMKAMAQQKLQSDVADLEHTLKKTKPKSSTVYLVPDAPALCTQLHLIMRLVGSEKFLLMIPLQVIAALDELKKYDSGAREAIKYLESEFKRGNRWVRAQKEGESMEDNKKRGRYEDVAVWRFNQIVNCCRYMVNQAGRGLVTLLTGTNSHDTPRRGQKRAVIASGTQATPEAVEFARRCGVNVESLRVFCARFSSVKAVT